MKYLILICVIIFIETNCARQKDNTIKIETQETIWPYTENHYADEIEVNVLSNNVNKYLIDYFPDEKYQILENPLDVRHRKIIFAVNVIKNFMDYNNDDILICDTIVGFEIIDNSFQRYLLVKNFIFKNIDDSLLYDFSEKYNGIYGFGISYSYPTVEGYNPGLNIDTYFDNGDRVADSFTITWNENKKNFEKVVWF